MTMLWSESSAALSLASNRSAARSFAQGALGAWGLESSEVVLVVSELSANAVRHAKSAFILALSFTGTTLTVEVTDASPARDDGEATRRWYERTWSFDSGSPREGLG